MPTASGLAGDAPALRQDIAAHISPRRFLVHRLSQPGIGSVNTWLIEAADGVIAIDGQRGQAAGRAVAEVIRGLQKPLAGVVLTHPHPDHVGGLGEIVALAAPGTPVLGLAETAAMIQSDPQGYFAASRSEMPDDFPARRVVPGRLVADGETLDLLGLRLRVRAFRDVEAPVMLTVTVEDAGAVFAADMVEHGMTAFLLEGRAEGWLAGLDAFEGGLPAEATGYPGHGPAGGARTLVAAQRDYLRRILALARGGSAEAAVAGMRDAFPGFLPVAAMPDLLERNIAVLQQGRGG